LIISSAGGGAGSEPLSNDIPVRENESIDEGWGFCHLKQQGRGSY
jgi:hypothetical protein